MGSVISPPAPGVPPCPAIETQRLSPSQRAFREDPKGFLERLHARAESLFQDGYTVRSNGEPPHSFVVSHTATKDKRVSEYIVSPLEETCTCPFFTRQAQGEHLGNDDAILLCKHLLGLSALIRETRLRLAKEKDLEALTALCRPWMIVVSLKRQKPQADTAPKERIVM